MATISPIDVLVKLVEDTGYHVWFSEFGVIEGYHARLEPDGNIKAIVHTSDRRCFWTISVPEADVRAGDVQAVKRLIESRIPQDETER